MQQAPDHRYQSTQEMKTDVIAARTPLVIPAPGLKPPAPGKPPRPRAPRPSPVVKKRTALYAALALTVCAVIGGAIYFGKAKAPTGGNLTASAADSKSIKPDPTKLNPSQPVPSAIPAEAKIFEGHSYQFVANLKIPWTDAKAQADAAGGHLATLTSKEEEAWATETFANNLTTDFSSFWLGGLNEGKATAWRWVTAEPFVFTAWGKDEPNGASRPDQGEPPYYINVMRAPNYAGGYAWNDSSLTDRYWKSQIVGFLVEWDYASNAGNPAPTAALEPGAIKLWDAPEKLPKDPAIQWENNSLRLGKANLRSGLHSNAPNSRDAIIRASIRANPDSGYPAIALRYGKNAEGKHMCCSLWVDMPKAQIVLDSFVTGEPSAPRKWPLPRSYGSDEWLLLELHAIGDDLTVFFDGIKRFTVRAPSLSEPGEAQVVAQANGYFRDIVYIPLDPPR